MRHSESGSPVAFLRAAQAEMCEVGLLSCPPCLLLILGRGTQTFHLNIHAGEGIHICQFSSHASENFGLISDLVLWGKKCICKINRTLDFVFRPHYGHRQRAHRRDGCMHVCVVERDKQRTQRPQCFTECWHSEIWPYASTYLRMCKIASVDTNISGNRHMLTTLPCGVCRQGPSERLRRV